jgi:beta-phosphoglucomutase-like phosphatase (HAD superfamily)
MANNILKSKVDLNTYKQKAIASEYINVSKIDHKITKDTILFFDMDGTLIDTSFANFLSYKKAIAATIQPKIELEYNPRQRFNRTLLKSVMPNLSKADYVMIVQQKEKFDKDFLTETKPIKAIEEILYRYSQTNKTVLVTNCRENRVTMILNYHRLTDKFSHIFCRHLSDSGTRINKYSNAINRLNILPQNIVVFENEEMEINDAIKAGIPSDNIIDV